MSNAQAIATVTAALRDILQDVGNRAVGGATVHVGRPDEKIAAATLPTIGLFLYQITPNQAVRNLPQPIRDGAGRLIETPAAIVDLHYLISFYGDGSKYQPELMAAEASIALESRPVLTRALMEKTIVGNLATIGESNIHRAHETVKATPAGLNLEEMSKLWSIFFQVPYGLSLPYRFSYVVLEPKTEGAPGLPVTAPVVSVLPVTKVRIESVESGGGPSGPITWGASLRIRGSGLSKPGILVRVDSLEVEVPEESAGPREITIDLKSETFGGEEVAAGVHGLRLVDPPPHGIPPRLVRTTDLVPFTLRPSASLVDVVGLIVDNGFASGAIKAEFSPKVVEGQSVRLMLEELVEKNPKSYVLAHKEIPGSDYPIAQLEFPFKKVKTGEYLLMAQVDGVYNAPEIQTDATQPDFGRIVGPKVTI